MLDPGKPSEIGKRLRRIVPRGPGLADPVWHLATEGRDKSEMVCECGDDTLDLPQHLLENVELKEKAKEEKYDLKANPSGRWTPVEDGKTGSLPIKQFN